MTSNSISLVLKGDFSPVHCTVTVSIFHLCTSLWL